MSGGDGDIKGGMAERRDLLLEIVMIDDRLAELEAMAEALGDDEDSKEETGELETKRQDVMEKLKALPVLGVGSEAWQQIKQGVGKIWKKFESSQEYGSQGVEKLKGHKQSLECKRCSTQLCSFANVVHVQLKKEWAWHPQLPHAAIFKLIHPKCRTLEGGGDDRVCDMYCGTCGSTVGFRVATDVEHYCISSEGVKNFDGLKIAIEQKRTQKATQRPGDETLDERILSMFGIVDADADGLIKFPEFTQAIEGLELQLPGGVEPRDLFSQLDRERKGAIDFSEFRDFCRRIDKWSGQNPEAKLKSIFELVDMDKSGSINLDQFRQAIKSMDFKLSEDNIDAVFKAIAKNTGFVQFDGFSTYVKQLAKRYQFDPFDELCMTPEERQSMTKMFTEIDTDSSGEIDWDEFVAANKASDWGWDRDKLKSMWDEIDLDGNGTLEFDEFVKAIRLGNIPCRELDPETIGHENLVEMGFGELRKRAGTIRDDIALIRKATAGRVNLQGMMNAEEEQAQLAQIRKGDKSVFSLKNSEPTPPLPKHRLEEVAEHVRSLGRQFSWKIKKNAMGKVESIPVAKIASIMKGLGHRPSPQELAEIIAHHAKDGAVSFGHFCEMLRWYEVSVTEDQVVLYFREFLDDGSGHMTLAGFKKLLMEISDGEMTEQDMTDVVQLVESTIAGKYDPAEEHSNKENILDDEEAKETKEKDFREMKSEILESEKLTLEQFLTAMRAILFM